MRMDIVISKAACLVSKLTNQEIRRSLDNPQRC
jgi:hypothetical protein